MKIELKTSEDFTSTVDMEKTEDLPYFLLNLQVGTTGKIYLEFGTTQVVSFEILKPKEE